jgi:hypothetical protein
MSQDKQLREVQMEAVLKKRGLDQALNVKEFAVLAGISYSTARQWFHLPGFPIFRGVVFWQDFVDWRKGQAGLNSAGRDGSQEVEQKKSGLPSFSGKELPPRVARILSEAA